MQENLSSHPSSLRVFFITEMWERYGFYVVQSLLALFLALHFKWPDKKVYFLVSVFTALNYLTPVIGGWVADHLLGQKRAIITGAVILLISYLCLALITTDTMLIVALALIPVGTGLLKPNISSLLGNEYHAASSKRDSGFTIFYMGLTGGIVLGTTLPNIINEYFGWSAAFSSACFGMLVAIEVFVYGVHRYTIADYHPSAYQWGKMTQALLICGLMWWMSYNILSYPYLCDVVIAGIALLSIAYFVYSVKRESASQSAKTLVIGLLCLISVLFFAFYFQMYMSLTLFIVRVVQPILFGVKFYPPYYISVQGVGLILFGLYFSSQKKQLTIKESGVLSANKFLMAIVFMMISYAAIALICHLSTDALMLSPLLFIPVYLLISLAEILLSPAGLSIVCLYANTKKVSTMVGIFFLTLGIGAFLSGKLAVLTAIPEGETSVAVLKVHYAHAFNQQFCILLVSTLMCIGLNLMIKRLLSKSCI